MSFLLILLILPVWLLQALKDGGKKSEITSHLPDYIVTVRENFANLAV